jgi:putative peptide maturation system protein
LTDIIEDWRDSVAMEVNGEEISLRQLLHHAQRHEPLAFLSHEIDAALIRQTVARFKIEVTAVELQQAANAFRAGHKLHSAQATREWLAAHGLTQELWEQWLREDVAAGKLRSQITESEVERRFAEQRRQFDAATISRLCVEEEDIARELRSQIREEGADFHLLARRHSLDKRSRPHGGYLGRLSRSEFEPTVQPGIFGAVAGQVVGPYRVEKIWTLYLVEALHPADLDDTTRAQIADQIFAEWLADERSRATILTPLLDARAEPQPR